MKARLQWVPGTDSYGLFLWNRYDNQPMAARIVDGRIQWDAIERPEGTPGPLLVIDAEAIEPIREAFSSLAITDGSGLNFLRDAVTTRDRLLTLVERLTEPKP